MKKFLMPVIAVPLLAALLSVPALAQPKAAAAPAPLPAKTTQPVDWETYAPGGELSPDKVEAKSAILVDARTGKVLFGKQADMRQYPASITKIMTCLVALENCGDLSEKVTIGTLPKLGDPEATSIDLKKGEKMTMENLLYGLMLESANDAANAIAIKIAGSVDQFLAMMNEKAQKLGMKGTHYTNTNGLADDEKHCTTASDMAKLAQAAMLNPEFVKIVSTHEYKLPATNKHPDPRTITNTNYLLDAAKGKSYYEYATGIKTGYTGMAQNTLVSSAQKDGVSLIAVTLNEDIRDNMWSDSITMFEYGFNFFDTVDLKELLAGKTIPVAVKDAAAGDPGSGNLELTLKPQGEGEVYITDRKDVIGNLLNDPSFRQEVSVAKDTAPILQGDIVGTVKYYYRGAPVLTCDLVASRAVEAMPTPAPTASPAPTRNSAANTPAPGGPSAAGGAVPAIVWVALAVLLAALAIITIRFLNMRRRRRRYRRYDYRQGGNMRMRR